MGDVVLRLDLHGGGGELLDGEFPRTLDAAAERQRVCSRGDVSERALEDGLRKHDGGGGTVARLVVGLDGSLLHELGAHVLHGVGEGDLLGDGDAVVGDEHMRPGSSPCAIISTVEGGLLVHRDIATLGAQRGGNSLRQLVDTFQQLLTCRLAMDDRHLQKLQSYLPRSFTSSSCLLSTQNFL